MKKVYSKPFLAVESFQLDAAIAGACADSGAIPLGHYQTTCDHDSGFFGSDLCAFNVIGQVGGDSNDGMCYHGPFATGGIVFLVS